MAEFKKIRLKQIQQDGANTNDVIKWNGSVWTPGTGGSTTSFADDVFEVYDDLDNTKKVNFQVSGVTTGTTRTLTIPNVSGTLALGTGEANKVTYWSSANELTSSTNFAYDGSLLSVGVASPQSNTRLTVKGGNTTTSTWAIKTLDSANALTFAVTDGGTISVGKTNPVILSASALTTDQAFNLGDSANTITLYSLAASSSATGATMTSGVGGMTINASNASRSTTSPALTVQTTNWTTSATNLTTMGIQGGFVPGSTGTSTYASLAITPTVNQTSGHTGITRGIYINPTLTTVEDYRAIDIATTTGKAIYQGSTGAINVLFGNTYIGGGASVAQLRFYEASGNGTSYTSFQSPDALAGNLIYTLPSDTPVNGDVLTWNTGGTLSWETPSGGATNLSWSGAGPYTLNSSTGTDVTFTAGTNITFNQASTDLTINADNTNISYTASTRAVASSTGTGFTFPLFTDTEAGLTPLSGGGTTNFLRADGTWTAPSGGATNLTFSGASSPVTLQSDTGTDVTFTAGTGISFSQTGNNLTITNDLTGTVDGTGSANKIAFWTDTNTLSFNSAFGVDTTTSTISTKNAAFINTTPTTGDTWEIRSSDAGVFQVYSTLNTINYLTIDTDGLTTLSTLSITPSGSTPNQLMGRVSTNGQLTTLTLGTGISISSGTINAATDLSYTASTRLLASSTGSDVTLPLFTSTEAGLTPLSGGGTTNFLRADGTWAAPPAGGATNLTFSGASSPVTLQSDTGTDVVFSAGTGISLSQTGNDLTITSTVTGTVDGTGSAGQVAYWVDSNTLTGHANFIYDGDQLVVGDTTPASATLLTTKGTNTGFSTFGYTHKDSNGTTVFQVADDGRAYVGATAPLVITSNTISPNSAANLSIGTNAAATYIYNSNTTTGVQLGSTVQGGHVRIGGITGFTSTSTNLNSMRFVDSFSPASTGTATFNAISMEQTINQTGGHTGITRGIYIAPTLTAFSDFRAIDIATTAASSYGIYQSGASVINYLNGNTGIGVAPGSNKLYVSGATRFDLGSDAEGDIYYRNNSGSFTRLPIGTNTYVLTSNGTTPSWSAPSGGGNGIYGGSGNIASAAVATIASGSSFEIEYNDGSYALYFSDSTGTAILSDGSFSNYLAAETTQIGLSSGSDTIILDESSGGTAINNDVRIYSGHLSLDSAVSPTSIATDQNDYAPTGHATASVMRLTSSANVNITGITNTGSYTNGRLLIVHNIGSYNITLVAESASSTAAYRFATPANVTLRPSESITFRYDNSSSRWRQIASSASGSDIDPAPAADHTAYGMTTTFTANEGQAFGDVVFINASGKAQLGDADAIATASCIAMCTQTVSTDGTASYLLQGIARDDTWNWTVGGPIFLSTTGTTGNTLTQTAPSGTGDVVQVLGVATHADRIYFSPSLSQSEL